MAFGNLAAASLVFGVLYLIMFVYMCFMYATKRYKWKSRFTILFMHAAIRVASQVSRAFYSLHPSLFFSTNPSTLTGPQACGVAFGIVVWNNLDVFVAYLILGAEGYFSLTIASYYFLRQYEIKHFDHSRLGSKDGTKSTWRRTVEIWSWAPLWAPWRYWNTELIMVVDSWLIPAK